MSSLIGAILNLFGKVLPLLFAYKSGKDSQKVNDMKGTLEDVAKAKKAKESVDNMSDDERDKWL